MAKQKWRSTTILCVRHAGKVAMAGDGQVTLGDTVIKQNAVKVRRLRKGTVLAGFAGSAADAFALLERFEAKLEESGGDIVRASTVLAKDWRTDKILRQLQAQLVVANRENTLILSGEGNVLEPSDQVAAIGSGAPYAKAAALAFIQSKAPFSAGEIAEKALKIASEICIYTNSQILLEEL